MQQQQQRILFVCLGNICRSPAAEAVLRYQVEASGLADRFKIDSAGTGAWHVGELADARMRARGELRGYSFTHRARQFQSKDFHDFDLILTMDQNNFSTVLKSCPAPELRCKVKTFVSYCQHHQISEVPDPYYGGIEGFDTVLNILEDGCSEILKQHR